MMDNPRWLIPLLTVLGVMLAGSLWQTLQWWAGGAHLNTEIAHLVPAGDMDPVNQRLYRNLLEQGSSRLLVVIEGESVTEVEDASIALQDGLTGMPGVTTVDAHPDPDRLDRLAKFLQPYREGLLSAEDRAALSADPEGTVNRWMAADPFFRPLPISRDPLGTLGRFIKAALPIPDRIESDGFFYWLERSDGQSYAIATFAELGPSGIGADRADRLQGNLEGLFDTIRSAHAVELNASSAIFHASAGKRRAKWESSVFGSLSAVFIISLLAFSFRSFQPVFELLLVVGVALLTGFAAAQRLFTDLHVLTPVMALPVIGIAVDYVIHSHVHRACSPEPGRGLPPYLLRALCWGCLSSALGYAALSGVDISLLRQVSVVLVVGLITALLWVIALAYLLPAPSGGRHVASLGASSLIRWAGRGRSPGRGKSAGALLVVIAAGFVAAWLGAVRIVDAPGVLYYVKPELVRADRQVQARLGLAGNRKALVVSGQGPQEILRRQEKVINELAARYGVRAVGVAGVVPPTATQQRNRALSARAYRSLSVDERISLRREGASLPDAAEGTDLYPDKLPAFLRRSLPPYELSGNEGRGSWAALTLAGAAALSEAASWCGERADCRVADSIDALTQVLAGVHRFARFALYTAVLLVSAVLLLRYRRRGLWAGMALILAMLGGYVIPGAFGLPVTLFGTAGQFVLLGLSVDYLVFTAETRGSRDRTWLAFVLSAATTSLTFGFLLFSLTPAVRMLAAPVVAGLPLLLGALYFVQTHLAPPDSQNREQGLA